MWDSYRIISNTSFSKGSSVFPWIIAGADDSGDSTILSPAYANRTRTAILIDTFYSNTRYLYLRMLCDCARIHSIDISKTLYWVINNFNVPQLVFVVKWLYKYQRTWETIKRGLCFRVRRPATSIVALCYVACILDYSS